MQLSLLGQHERAISGRLEQLGHVPSGSDHSALVLPLHPFNPLIPQEQISSKYGAMVRQSLPQLVNPELLQVKFFFLLQAKLFFLLYL